MDGDQESSTSSQTKFPLFLVPAKYIIHPTPRLFFSFHDYQFPPLSTLSCRFHDLHEMVGRLLLATISRFSSRLLRETEPVGASLHEFDRRVFIRGWYVPVSRAASGSLRPPPSFPSSLANYASSRKKESGYYTRVLLVNSLFPPRDPICEECPRNSQSYVQISTFLAGNHILSPWSTIVGVRRGRERGGGEEGDNKIALPTTDSLLILLSIYYLFFRWSCKGVIYETRQIDSLYGHMWLPIPVRFVIFPIFIPYTHMIKSVFQSLANNI